MPSLLISQPAEPDVGAGEDLPDRADHVPRDQQRQRHQHQASPRRPTPRAGIASARPMPSGIWIASTVRLKTSWRTGAVQILVGQRPATNQSVPTQTRSCGPEDVLEGVVDHGHQRHDRAERDQHEHRQDQQPGAIVVGLVHAGPVSRPAGRRHRAGSARRRRRDGPSRRAPRASSSSLALTRVRPEPAVTSL